MIIIFKVADPGVEPRHTAYETGGHRVNLPFIILT